MEESEVIERQFSNRVDFLLYSVALSRICSEGRALMAISGGNALKRGRLVALPVDCTCECEEEQGDCERAEEAFENGECAEWECWNCCRWAVDEGDK